MMSATPNLHDSQYKMQNNPIKKDEVCEGNEGYRKEGYISPKQRDYNVGVLTVIGTRNEW